MTTQNEISKVLHVVSPIDVVLEIETRIHFLKTFIKERHGKAFVLGISGGIDSAVAGELAQMACRELRDEGYPAMFIAMRLPYGVQRDELDAEAVLQYIKPDKIITTNIKAASDAMLESLPEFTDPVKRDFHLGNIKARQRMIAQYAIAGAESGMVIGTDHAAEAVMGFFTKHGDGACDLTPLSGLNKRQVRQVGGALGFPSELVFKTPTADLEDLNPGKPDEDAYGVTYDEIDDFLEGKKISEQSEQLIIDQYNKTSHKRDVPADLYNY